MRPKLDKLEPKTRIRRRLAKLWSETVRRQGGDRCAVCGRSGLDTKLDAHHIEARACRPLRYDPQNGILLCPSHHKFGLDSFHRSPVWSMAWLRHNMPDVLDHVLSHRLLKLDLDDRPTLEEIERRLREAPLHRVGMRSHQEALR